MFNILSYIGEKLNEEGVTWGVGASILLNKFGLIDKPNDIDLLVDLKDIEKVDAILKSIGKKKKCKETDTYTTQYFYEYIINDIDVDVMSGLRINHNEGMFKYIFDQSSISDTKKINGVNIPFTSLEDWYIIYQLIPNREAKVNKIEKYFLTNRIKRPDLFERALKCNLPKKVIKKINRMLKIHEEQFINERETYGKYIRNNRVRRFKF